MCRIQDIHLSKVKLSTIYSLQAHVNPGARYLKVRYCGINSPHLDSPVWTSDLSVHLENSAQALATSSKWYEDKYISDFEMLK